MKLIGITGGIGSGKSTIAKVFRACGYPIYNSDNRAKELINSDVKLIQAIKDNYGKDIYDSTNLNRKKMASIVFSNPEKLALLNSFVHPAVGRDFDNWLTKQNTPFVIKEAAIIFETGIYKSLDKTIVVSAPKAIRIDRVMARDTISQADVEARMKNQWSEEEKIKLADFVIDNSGQKLVIPQVQAIIKELM